MFASPIAKFWDGFWSPLKSLLFILRSPSLLTLVIIPLTINIGMYYLFFSYGSAMLSSLIQSQLSSWSANLPQGMQWLIPLSQWSLKILSWLLLLLTSVITFTVVSSIVAAPFNEILSKQTEKLLSRKNSEGTNQFNLTPHQKISFLTSIQLELKRTFVLIAGGITAFLIGLIPLMQIPALMLAALLIAFEYFGIPISRKSTSLWAPTKFAIANFFSSLGLGSFLLIMMAIPMASILYIPLSVVSGTMLYCKQLKN